MKASQKAQGIWFESYSKVSDKEKASELQLRGPKQKILQANYNTDAELQCGRG